MQNELNKAQYNRMTQTPIPRLILSLAIPTIISMLVTALYNMADTYFVSQLGTSASGAVGIVFSLMALIQAVGFMLGMGSGALISALLGRQQTQEADKVASTGFFSALAFGLALTVLGLFFLDGMMWLLGSTPTILPFARDYAKYILFGAPVMCASFVLNNILRAEGRAVFSMVGLTLGGVLNILLDPIFIFTLGLGISGAAIATLISQCIGFCLLLLWFLLKKTSAKISLRLVSRRPETYLQILKTGFPSFCRQGLASISTTALNVNASVYGDPAVAAMSIVGRIFLFVLSAMIGFGQGFQPVAGFNYGAKRYDRVKQSFCFSVAFGVVLMTVLGVIGFFIAPQAIAAFRRDDTAVMEIGAYAFRAQCLVLPLIPLSVVCNMAFQSLGRSWQATFLSSARQGVFFLPLILILPPVLGLTGVQITQPLADLLTFGSCFPFLFPFFRDLNAKEEAQRRAQPAPILDSAT